MTKTRRMLMAVAVMAAAFSAGAGVATAAGDPRTGAINVADQAHPSLVGLATLNRPTSSMARQAKAEDEHVRSPQAVVAALLRDGTERSETFSRLVAALNGSDVVAYIGSSVRMPTGLDGYLAHHVIVAGNRRYLRILVNAGLGRDRLLAIIAHELQHAVEVAQAPEVQSDAAVRALFQRLDSGRCVYRCTETDEAIHIQEAVLRELLASRDRR
jgi:hypothetical protein